MQIQHYERHIKNARAINPVKMNICWTLNHNPPINPLKLKAKISMTHRMPSWCLRKVHPSRFGSPRRGLWYIACWGPIFAYVVVCCFHASPSAGWWNEAASSPKWSRNSPGRIPAFGRTTSTGTRSPWRGSLFVLLCARFRMSWASWCLRGVVYSFLPSL